MTNDDVSAAPQATAASCGDEAAHREHCDETLARRPAADNGRDGVTIVLPTQLPQPTAAAARGLLNVIVKAANKAGIVADDSDPDLD